MILKNPEDPAPFLFPEGACLDLVPGVLMRDRGGYHSLVTLAGDRSRGSQGKLYGSTQACSRGGLFFTHHQERGLRTRSPGSSQDPGPGKDLWIRNLRTRGRGKITEGWPDPSPPSPFRLRDRLASGFDPAPSHPGHHLPAHAPGSGRVHPAQGGLPGGAS